MHIPELPLVLKKIGIDQDGDARLSLSEFLDFVQSCIMSELPEPFVAEIRKAHAAAAAAAPDGAVDRRAAAALLASLGIAISSPAVREELMEVMDADGSGDASAEEVITCIGMMRRTQLDLEAVARAFSSAAGENMALLSATRLSEFLGLSVADANDLIFLADMDRFEDKDDMALTANKATIDMEELHNVIMHWA